jgi:putative transposase
VAVLARRREDAAELGRRQRRASRRARVRLAPITAPGPITDITAVSGAEVVEPVAVEAGYRSKRGDRDRDLRRLGMTTLLELHRDFDYWNPPEPTATTGPVPPVDLDGGDTVEVPR